MTLLWCLGLLCLGGFMGFVAAGLVGLPADLARRLEALEEDLGIVRQRAGEAWLATARLESRVPTAQPSPGHISPPCPACMSGRHFKDVERCPSCGWSVQRVM